MRFSPLLLDNLEKKLPEDCASEHVNRTANRRTSRATCQLAILFENRAQGYRNTKKPSYNYKAIIVYMYINIMPLWYTLIMCLLVPRAYFACTY